MKRLWIALLLLTAIASASWAHTRYLTGFTDRLTGLLAQAEALADEGDWDSSLSLTETARALWGEGELYLHITLRHSDTDAILLSFSQVRELLLAREEGEYSAANAVLIGQLGLLCEQECLNLKNLL